MHQFEFDANGICTNPEAFFTIPGKTAKATPAARIFVAQVTALHWVNGYEVTGKGAAGYIRVVSSKGQGFDSKDAAAFDACVAARAWLYNNAKGDQRVLSAAAIMDAETVRLSELLGTEVPPREEGAASAAPAMKPAKAAAGPAVQLADEPAVFPLVGLFVAALDDSLAAFGADALSEYLPKTAGLLGADVGALLERMEGIEAEHAQLLANTVVVTEQLRELSAAQSLYSVHDEEQVTALLEALADREMFDYVRAAVEVKDLM